MSKKVEIILDPNTITMLTEMQAVFSKFNIDYYLAGAYARDVQFLTKNPETNFRQTLDVDLAVSISAEERYNEVIDALLETGSFVRDDDEPIKFRYRLGIEVDLIPFGEIEDENRVVKLTKPIAFTLQMPGFAEVAAFTEEISSGGLTLKTCPIEGLVMLKLISWDDKQRTHDLTDIDNIIDAYFDWNSDEIYSKYFEVIKNYDPDDLYYYKAKIAAHTIGLKIKILLSDSLELLERVIKILSRRQNPRWEALSRGLRE